MTRSISPSWLSWVMELRLLQVLEETEEGTEEELVEPLDSRAALVKAGRLCQLQPPLEGTGAAGEVEREEREEVSKHPQPNL